jgi:hypothetical protein
MDLLDAPHLSGQTLVADAQGDLVKGMPYVFGGRPFQMRRPRRRWASTPRSCCAMSWAWMRPRSLVSMHSASPAPTLRNEHAVARRCVPVAS